MSREKPYKLIVFVATRPLFYYFNTNKKLLNNAAKKKNLRWLIFSSDVNLCNFRPDKKTNKKNL